MPQISFPQGNDTYRRIAYRIATGNAGATLVEDLLEVTITAPRRLEIWRRAVEDVAGPIDDAVWQSFTRRVKGRVTRADSACIVVED